MSGQRDHIFGKKVVPSFPMGKRIENEPSQTVLQADWKGEVSLIRSFVAWESMPEWRQVAKMSHHASVLEVGVGN